MSNLPSHLGGQVYGNVDLELVKYLKEKFKIESLIDIGCGDGMAIKNYPEKLGLDCYGVDGDWTRMPKTDQCILHDFSEGKIEFDPEDTTFDCSDSIEFLEHVEEEYQENYMDLFSKGKLCVVTAALPGQGGHHHVNCRPQEYWYEVFEKYGYEFLPDETAEAGEISNNKTGTGGEQNQWFKNTGMIFKKK